MPADQVIAVVPIRSWVGGKSRLEVDDEWRRRLARAFSLDVLEALRGSARVAKVIVVTSDDAVNAELRNLDFVVVADPGEGLNAAIAAGASSQRDWTGPVLVVPADLPALSSVNFEEALNALQKHRRSFIPDADGDGTSLLYAAQPSLLTSAYGPNSAKTHEELGAVPIRVVAGGVRRDVDSWAQLLEAERLGLGPHTADALRSLRRSVHHVQ